MGKASPKFEAVMEESVEDPRYHVMAKALE